MSILDTLLVVFIVLKLVGVITWSWWWVMSPVIFVIMLHFLLYAVGYGEKK